MTATVLRLNGHQQSMQYATYPTKPSKRGSCYKMASALALAGLLVVGQCLFLLQSTYQGRHRCIEASSHNHIKSFASLLSSSTKQRQRSQLLGTWRLAAATDHFNSSRCSTWLSEYEEWHVRNRNAPGAKYLLAEGPGFVGIGDHLRGFMFALRIAVATNRVLLLHWEHPGNLTDFLLPGSHINWTWEGTPAQALLAERALNASALQTSTADLDVYRGPALAQLYRGKPIVARQLSNKTFMLLQTGLPAGEPCEDCPQVVHRSPVRLRDYDHVCMFRYLFKPSPLVEQSTDEQLQLSYPSYSPGSRLTYQATHLRLGQMHGETSTVNRVEDYGDPLATFLMSVSCGKDMAANASIDTEAVPLLFVADHTKVRRFSKLGTLAGVVTPHYEAVHTKMNSVESHLQSFVELNLLACATCVVLSHSGFSNVAWWMSGGNPCMLLLSDCYRKCNSTSSSRPAFCL